MIMREVQNRGRGVALPCSCSPAFTVINCRHATCRRVAAQSLHRTPTWRAWSGGVWRARPLRCAPATAQCTRSTVAASTNKRETGACESKISYRQNESQRLFSQLVAEPASKRHARRPHIQRHLKINWNQKKIIYYFPFTNSRRKKTILFVFDVNLKPSHIRASRCSAALCAPPTLSSAFSLLLLVLLSSSSSLCGVRANADARIYFVCFISKLYF